jgi:hypothetical protein
MKKRLKILATIGIATLLVFVLGSLQFLQAQGAASQPTVFSVGTSSSDSDTTDPSDVANLKAVPGDSEVKLTWDASTDNVSVTGYKIFRGTHALASEDDQYDLPEIPVGAVTSYTVKNLTNGQKYYFSMVAVDAASNESGHYAAEVNATPASGLKIVAEDDGKPPEVKEVKAEDVITVLVVFTEAVKLPEEHPASAIRIEKITDKSRLEVQKAELDMRDDSGGTVLLITAPQETDAEYIVTAGIEMEDLLGNPVVSGTSDTGSFKGSSKKKEVAKTAPLPSPVPTPPAAAADTDPPKLTAGSADFNNRMSITFSEKVQLPPNPKSQFTAVKKGTAEALKIINVSLSVDGKTAYLTTDPQKPVEYEVKVAGVKDLAGNELAASASSIVVSGKGSGLEDLVPPEDVMNLIARIKDAKTNLVELRWEASKNSAGDLADQSLYQSDDKEGAKFGNGTSLGTSTTAVEVEDLKGGNWYTFKVTAKDTSENENKGAVTSIFLPETGPGAVAAGLTALVMGWYRRKKGKNRS